MYPLKLQYISVLTVLTVISHTSSTAVDYDGIVTINLQHAINGDNDDNPIFTDRGNFTMHGLKSAPLPYVIQSIQDADRQRIKQLAFRNQFYKLKSTVVINDVVVSSFLSTVKACMLAESELNDILSISLDYTGRIITITSTVASTSTCEGTDVDEDKLKSFTTSVYLRHTENGPMPDTATYVQKLERERLAKERGEGKDNRSFLEKYWMYIIPIIIMMVISSTASPDGGNAGGGR